MIYSDLAVEFAKDNDAQNVKSVDTISDIVQRMDIVDKGLFHDWCGIYYDIDASGDSAKLEEAIASCIKEYNYNYDKIMFVGLGNAKYISDALGEMVLDNLPAPNSQVVKLKPLVSRMTGIESHDIILAAKKIVKPTLVIAIDSLATTDIEKVGKSVQITNVGLTPGSGVGNSRKILTCKSLGVPILAIGVPLVANINYNDKRRLVSPIDIEDIAENLANTISNSIRQILA